MMPHLLLKNFRT